VNLSPNEVNQLFATSSAFFQQEPNLLKLKAPVKIVGSLFGQFHDLLEVFELSGYPPETAYLFLGNYVDRG
jgi:serine/threonine-protein phosphatase PP1 catalytic subunit